MATTSTSTAVAAVELVLTEPERLALAGFLAGYTGLTPRSVRAGPAPVRQLVPAEPPATVPGPPRRHRVLRRAMEAQGRARATFTRRLCTIAGFLQVRRRRGTPRPLAPRTARAIDLAVGERSEGPVFLAADGRRLDRHGAARIVRRVAGRAGICKPVGPHTLRHAFITAGAGLWGAAARCAGSRLARRSQDHDEV
jgi:hypothetical protein